MTIAFEIGAGIGSAGFIGGIGCVPIYDSPEIEKDRPLSPESPSCTSSESSSIGKDSDDVGGELEKDEGAGTGEVQSAYKGMLNGMESMLESLPIRRGISNFYAGKAKSFISLSDAAASCASAEDMAKAENAYSRRRKNLLASKILFKKHRSNLLRCPVGGIAKRPVSHRRRPLALAAAMNSSPRTITVVEHGDSRPPDKSAAVAEDSVEASSTIFSFPMRSFSLGNPPVLKNPDSSTGPNGEL